MSKVDDILAWAKLELGKPYQYGAEGPDTFDCSGLVQYVFAEEGISLPRTAHEQQRATTPVSVPAPGDLVFYGNPAHHVGIYIGNGRMIDAPDVGLSVRTEGVGTPTNYGRVTGSGAGSSALLDRILSPFTGGSSSTGTNPSGATPTLTAVAIATGIGLMIYGLHRAVSSRDHTPAEVSG